MCSQLKRLAFRIGVQHEFCRVWPNQSAVTYQNTTRATSNEKSDFEKSLRHPFCVIRILYIQNELEDRLLIRSARTTNTRPYPKVSKWWLETGSNRRRRPFQGRLAMELSGLESADIIETIRVVASSI